MKRNGGTNALEVKIEVVRVQLAGLEKTFSEMRDETRRWREDVKSEAATVLATIAGRMDKHDVSDDGRHSEIARRIDRVENESLAGAKMLVERVEILERGSAAQGALDTYRKWLITMGFAMAASLGLNALTIAKFFGATMRMVP